ncbi:phosphatidylglycerophosphatase A family protein [Aliikangiella coralliicola]|uniref:Phosphatidylglycerophosphatase A n=1 Tax=Aliikangiella coralliicola TaxID=2592383 RepID=A0A545U748_9GAMM|nr:phosphatidylglycerophosphatase A [Aliikangiella coralliicola]TQV85292.1 phosphatidylglycerophosphatase A [Aliikangiella coralliicola]
MSKPVPAKFVFSHPVHFLSFGFGSGLAPKAPGTFGTLAAIPLYLLVAELSLAYYLLTCALVSLVGIYFCHHTANRLKVHDHPGIVWDEIAGFLITMIGFAATWQNLLIGFVLFRIFDILKPWPIKWIDKHVSGGFGIMLDDLIAGGFAWCCLYGVNHLWL